MDKKATIAQARKLRGEDELEESQELLLELLAEYPEDPLVLFEVGGAHDVLGEAYDAISYYQQAIQHNLQEPDLQECMICLALNQRFIGEAAQAVSRLEEAAAKFPDDHSIRAFLALAHYSNGEPEEAIRLLLDVLLQTTGDENILTYADTLDYYKDNLDEVWDE